ncbi:hypothetical protein OIU79_029643 [Salix purpurea]|uniref:Uncharacterized protein n=1 Tax=Salix purpurea TaxID=77065 RepID=A0A9Q0VHJ8_SALPP|nr:hypothetical protein OIU79_029643 [Salix purpurea]
MKLLYMRGNIAQRDLSLSSTAQATISLSVHRAGVITCQFGVLSVFPIVRLQLTGNWKGRLQGKVVRVDKKTNGGYRVRLDCGFGEIAGLRLEMIAGEGSDGRESDI